MVSLPARLQAKLDHVHCMGAVEPLWKPRLDRNSGGCMPTGRICQSGCISPIPAAGPPTLGDWDPGRVHACWLASGGAALALLVGRHAPLKRTVGNKPQGVAPLSSRHQLVPCVRQLAPPGFHSLCAASLLFPPGHADVLVRPSAALVLRLVPRPALPALGVHLL